MEDHKIINKWKSGYCLQMKTSSNDRDTVFPEAAYSKGAKALYDKTLDCSNTRYLLDKIGNHNIPTLIHSRGVGKIASHFIREALTEFFSEEDEKSAVRVNILHDLGKTSVPNAILNYAGPLSSEQWRVIQDHTISGFREYSTIFGAEEGLPILLHHTFQNNKYPDEDVIEKIVSEYGLSKDSVNDEMVKLKTFVISFSDQFEAAVPYHNPDNPKYGVRKYSDRRYSLDKLPELVEFRLSSPSIREIPILGKAFSSLLATSRDLVSDINRIIRLH